MPATSFHSSKLGRALHVAYVLLAVAAFVSAVSAWRLRCEGFGCTGIGILWAAWLTFVFCPTLVLGVFLSFKEGTRTPLSVFSRRLLWAQLALGGTLTVYWLVGQFR